MDGSFSEANSQNAKCSHAGNLLVVQWLELGASTAGDMGSIPGHRTKISYAVRWQRGGGGERKSSHAVSFMYFLICVSRLGRN